MEVSQKNPAEKVICGDNIIDIFIRKKISLVFGGVVK